MTQSGEVTENTKTGARGLIIPATTQIGNPAEDTLLPDTVAELERLGITPREVALDGGFNVGPTAHRARGFRARANVHRRPTTARQPTNPAAPSRATGPAAKGRISHLKRGYGLRRSRLKDHDGMQIWTGWSILTYNLDTLAIRSS